MPKQKCLFLFESLLDRPFLHSVSHLIEDQVDVEIVSLQESQNHRAVPEQVICAVRSPEALHLAETLNHQWVQSQFILINTQESQVPIEVASNGYDHIFYGEKAETISASLVRILTKKLTVKNTYKKAPKSKNFEVILKATLLAGDEGHKILQDAVNALLWENYPAKGVVYWKNEEGLFHRLGNQEIYAPQDVPLSFRSEDFQELDTVTVVPKNDLLGPWLKKTLKFEAVNLILKIQEEGLEGLVILELPQSQVEDEAFLEEMRLATRYLSHALKQARVLNSLQHLSSQIDSLLDEFEAGLIRFSTKGQILQTNGQVCRELLNKKKSPVHISQLAGNLSSLFEDFLSGDERNKSLYCPRSGKHFRLKGIKSKTNQWDVLLISHQQTIAQESLIFALEKMTSMDTERKIETLDQLLEAAASQLQNDYLKITIKRVDHQNGLLPDDLDKGDMLTALIALAHLTKRQSGADHLLIATSSFSESQLNIDLRAERKEDNHAKTKMKFSATSHFILACLRLENQGVSFSLKECSLGFQAQLRCPVVNEQKHAFQPSN